MLLPAAVLQAMCWMLCPAWLRTLGAPPDRWQRVLPALGVAAGVVLVLYGTFLGTEGEGYRWMRRYGVVFYFGLTAIGALVVSDQMLQQVARASARAPHRLRRVRAMHVAAAARAGPRAAAALVVLARGEARVGERHRVVGQRDLHRLLLRTGMGVAQDALSHEAGERHRVIGRLRARRCYVGLPERDPFS